MGSELKKREWVYIQKHVEEVLGIHFHRYHLLKKEIQLFTKTDNGMEYVPFCCPLQNGGKVNETVESIPAKKRKL